MALRAPMVRQLKLVSAGQHSQRLTSLEFLRFLVGARLNQHQRRWRFNPGAIMFEYAVRLIRWEASISVETYISGFCFSYVVFVYFHIYFE